jgi:hypothetical protein
MLQKRILAVRRKNFLIGLSARSLHREQFKLKLFVAEG